MSTVMVAAAAEPGILGGQDQQVGAAAFAVGTGAAGDLWVPDPVNGEAFVMPPPEIRFASGLPKRER